MYNIKYEDKQQQQEAGGGKVGGCREGVEGVREREREHGAQNG